MCLLIISGPHVAQKDIYTVKMAINIDVEKGQFQSPYRKYHYRLGSEYNAEIARTNDRIVEEGIHSLNIEEFHLSGWVCNDAVGKTQENRVGSGFVLCRIPRGSTYYIGLSKDIVSDKLVAVEILSLQVDSEKAIISDEEVENYGYLNLAAKTQYKLTERKLNGLPEVQNWKTCV